MAGNEKRLIDANELKIRFDEKEYDDIELYGAHIIECFPSKDANKIVDEMPTVDAVPVADIEAWLYQIAMNNTDNTLCGACEELIRRLDGLRQFSKEREE